jgi:hypothetical protein
MKKLNVSRERRSRYECLIGNVIARQRKQNQKPECRFG